MTTTFFKWVHRCLGWLLLGCVATAVLWGYVIHRRIGYGQLEIRLYWRDRPYMLDPQSSATAELLIGGTRKHLESGKVVSLRPGSIALQLTLKDFYPCSITTNIIKDLRSVAEFRLQAEPRTISIGNVISNAMINGVPAEGTWLLTNAEVGRSYRIEATAPGYHTNTLTLQIQRPGVDLITNLSWRHLMGFVAVKVTPSLDNTACFIDGTQLSSATGGFAAAGTHLVTASNIDYYPYSQPLEVAHGLTNLCEIFLKPKPASLSVEVTPPVQYQLRDGVGRLIPVDSGTARLSPGSNSLSITAKGYTSQQQDFIMEPNRSYSWKLQLEREGLQNFKRAQLQFDSLASGPILELLEKSGGRAWAKIKSKGFDREDLVAGAKQYDEAYTNLTAILENINAVDTLKRRFLLSTTDTNNAALLQKYGGTDWQRIRGVAFETDDVVHCAQQYKDACEKLDDVLKSIPDRGRAWTNEIRSSNAVDYWLLITGAAVSSSASLRAFSKATNELALYIDQFGPGTDFERWFGSSAGKIKHWQDEIRQKQRYQSDLAPDETKKR